MIPLPPSLIEMSANKQPTINYGLGLVLGVFGAGCGAFLGYYGTHSVPGTLFFGFIGLVAGFTYGAK